METGKKLAGIELRNKRKFSWTLEAGNSFNLKKIKIYCCFAGIVFQTLISEFFKHI